MKLFISRILCRYEGTDYAIGIFSTEEKARQAIAWHVRNTEYFSEYHHETHVIDTIEVDDTSQFDKYKSGMIQYLDYIVTKIDDEGINFEQEQQVLARTVLIDLKETPDVY